MKKTNYESEAYNSGWLDGYNALVVDLYEGFNEMLPTWLLEVVGGKKVVSTALKWNCDDADLILERDYEAGGTAGYDELLEEVVEAFKEKKTEMPMFLKQIVGDADSLKLGL